jgi:hypothetical protein
VRNRSYSSASKTTKVFPPRCNVWTADITLFLVKSIAMTNSLDDNLSRLYVELNAVIAGPNTEVSRQIFSQGLRSANVRPFRKAVKDSHDSIMNRRG